MRMKLNNQQTVFTENFLKAISLLSVAVMLFMFSGCTYKSEIARLQKALDVLEVQNVMSRHAWYYSTGQHERELTELFALEMPDVSWGSEHGWWVGKDLLWEYYVTYFDEFRQRDLEAFATLHPEVEVKPENLGAGTSMFHTNTTPIIEVAADGKTAKGMWYSIGQVTQTPGGVQTPNNMWERYGIDFIKIDGKWKIWHFMVNTDLAWNEGDGSWIREGGPGFGPGPGPGPGAGPGPGGDAGNMLTGADASAAVGQAGESGGAPQANVPARQGGFSSPFAPPRESELMPIPIPYNTFDETFTYGPPRDAT